MTRVVILGARGYLGTALQSIYPDAATPRIDIADRAEVAACLDSIRPDVVINAAGRAGAPNVDWCEEHREETIHSNVTGPLVLLEECGRRNVYWVHLGTGCVYEGDAEGQGYTEEDLPNFAGSFYVRTKAWIDQMLREFPVLVLRPRMPFDDSDHPRNLICKLRSYPRVLDVANSLTCRNDFLRACQQLVADRQTGLFNVVNPGALSPADVMDRYRQIVDPGHAFERLPLEELATVARAGRSNCLLNVQKLSAAGIQLPHVEEALDATLRRFADRRSAIRA